MTEREEWLLSMYDHIRNVEGSKRPPGFPPNESEYMEAVELDRARRQAAERMKYGTIEQGPTGFMADYIRPIIDSMEQRWGGTSPETGVSTADLLSLGMLGGGIGGSAIRPRPSSGVPTPPRPTIDQMQRTGKKQFEDELRDYLRRTEQEYMERMMAGMGKYFPPKK